MNGKIKKMKHYPVTLTEAIYFEGTSKTLQDAINNGELGGGGGTSVLPSENFIVDAFLLINDVIFTKNIVNNSITINLNKKK